MMLHLDKPTRMKRHCFFLALILAGAIYAAVPTRYFVGKTEVNEDFWLQIPDSVGMVIGEWDYDTLVVRLKQLQMTHYIDSLSNPGEFALRRRSTEEVVDLRHRANKAFRDCHDKKLSLHEGDLAPQISLTRFSDGEIIDDVIVPGECCLLSFWATWCGTCIKELRDEALPSVLGQFKDNPDFHFIPICIDSSREDLQEFFASRASAGLEHLAETTCLDTKRNANKQFQKDSGGRMPFNVVIGGDGRIRFARIGLSTGSADDPFSTAALVEAIKSGLQPTSQTPR